LKTNKEVSDLDSTNPKVKPVVPSMGRLLQPVERLVEAEDPVRLRGINKPHQLATVDCLRESTIQEHILHIKLVDRPGTRDDQ
jgi:hypothetical protein